MSNFILKTLETRELKLNTIRLRGFYGGKLRKGSGGGGSGDGFPQLPGDVTRWHFGGLTNEMMAAMDDPRIEDADGKGRFLSFKNFAWGGMSGVGGYVDNWNSSADWAINSYWVNSHTDHKLQFITASSVVQARSNNIYNAENVYKNILNVNGLTEAVNKGSVKALRIIATDPITSKAIKTFSFETNGVIQISFDDVLQDYYVDYFLYGSDTKDIDITIEQLPLYPGFILGDGVDDFAVTEKELNFEDTYTVYTAFIPFQNDPANNMVLCGKNHLKDFYITYSDLNRITFYSAEKLVFESLSKGFNILCCKRTPDKMVIKNLITDKSSEILANDLIDNPGLYYLWKGAVFANYAKAAIAGQIIDNGHFTTDEEDENILNWHKKQYPWLFPDQAWTVTGKTNEDEDRATIANITGNGNNLVLSNFGFAEGSGYGLYAENYAGGRWVQSTDRADLTWTSYSVNITSVKVASTQLYYQSYPEQPSFIVPSYKIKVYGLKDGQTLSYRQATSEGQQLYKISEDGTYTLPSFLFKANGDWYGFTLNKVQESCDITIEQIPYYEGYLVTDGVDDKIASSDFKMGKDFTIVGDWKFIDNKKSGTGLVKGSSFYIYNTMIGLDLYINSGSVKNSLDGIKSINAACSDGRAYDRNWNEILANTGNVVGSGGILEVSSSGGRFDRIAFKNLAIYPRILSKDDCIKAYNYLQTLKAK